MTALTHERCVACRADSPQVTDQEVADLHVQIPDWKLTLEDGIRELQRKFRFRNFTEALAFSNEVGNLAEAEGHHPRIVTEWGRVTVTWWTHKIRGLHRNDFIMSARTDQLYLEWREGSRR